jgi:hypothetical protein
MSAIKPAEPAKLADNIRPAISYGRKNASATETTIQKLNELAKKRPFCCHQKARKHDPL